MAKRILHQKIQMLRYLLLIILCGVVIQCANRIGLEGGLKDDTPPALNTEDSDENFKTNFKDDKFELVFDEFVKVDKPAEQIVISPPLQYTLVPVVRGKRIIFQFNEEEKLLENTTYTIQFGESIQDITESNPISNLRYVFSTGSVIDSMQMLVRVRDMISRQVVPDVLVMLYETLSDTVIRSGRPIYFSKTDSSGIARVENCRPGNFRIIALHDENNNYHLDLSEEKIGHIDTFIQTVVAPDEAIDLFIYRELVPPVLLDVRRIDTSIYALTIDGDINYIKLTSLSQSSMDFYVEADTLFVQTANSNDSLVLSSDYTEPDTIYLSSIKQQKQKSRFDQMRIKRETAYINSNSVEFHIEWNNPVMAIDQNQFRIQTDDSVWILAPDLSLELDTSNKKVVLGWQHDNCRDSVLLLPGLVTSWTSSHDTIIRELRLRKPEFLSNLIVEVQQLDTTQQYILQLKSSRDELIDETIISGVGSDKWIVEQLDPTTYRLDIITDFNKNGRKDLGWFDFRQFPEPVNSLEIDNLRADWDVQVAIKPSE